MNILINVQLQSHLIGNSVFNHVKKMKLLNILKEIHKYAYLNVGIFNLNKVVNSIAQVNALKIWLQIRCLENVIQILADVRLQFL